MSSPFDASRDCNVGTGYAFDDEPDMSNDAGALADGLMPVSDALGEEDYRD